MSTLTTYPIHPGDRLQRRIATVLTNDILSITPLFTGCQVIIDREEDEQAYPCIAVRVGETQNTPPGSHVWHVGITIHLMEDRQEANDAITGDTRPRHELRTENISARLFGIWDSVTLDEEINLISDSHGVYVLKIYNQNVAQTPETDYIGTEWSFTAICVSTQQ
jgi:hypothetical protein